MKLQTMNLWQGNLAETGIYSRSTGAGRPVLMMAGQKNERGGFDDKLQI